MASKKDSAGKSGGLMGLVMPVVLVILVGVGVGYGVGNVLGTAPDAPAAEAAASHEAEAPAADGHGKPAKDAHGESKDAHGAAAADGHGDTADGEELQEEVPIDPADVAVTFLPPVVTNIADPQSVWIRLEGEFTYLKSGEKKPDVLAPIVSEQIVNYLRTLKLSDLQGTDGIHFISEDINNIARTLNGGQVREVLITGLIVE